MGRRDYFLAPNTAAGVRGQAKENAKYAKKREPVRMRTPNQYIDRTCSAGVKVTRPVVRS